MLADQADPYNFDNDPDPYAMPGDKDDGEGDGDGDELRGIPTVSGYSEQRKDRKRKKRSRRDKTDNDYASMPQTMDIVTEEDN